MNPVRIRKTHFGDSSRGPRSCSGSPSTLAVWLAKRREAATGPGTLGATFACANCGRRGSREHMVPQVHDGAVSYYCSHCAGSSSDLNSVGLR